MADTDRAVLETALTDLRTCVELLRPLPWHVGERPTNRSMHPIRDRYNKIAAFAPNELIAQLIVRLANGEH